MLSNNKRAPARRAVACFVAAACLVALLPLRAAAWADDGHKTVAVIAYGLLTERARYNVDALLMGHTVDAVVMWPDELRYIGSPKCVTPESEGCNPNYRPETGDWHQVDLRYEGSGRFSPRDCPTTREGDCVVAAIEDFKKVLTSATRGKLSEHSPQNRRKYHDALRFMLHFVGDIHQPLHCANRNRDAGGNGVPVTWADEPEYPYGEVWNLHAVWDDIMVSHDMKKAGKTGFADYAVWLEGGLPAQARAYAVRKSDWITKGQPETTVAWAERSHQL
ncbi:MAG TPA: S1/P1 nuclease, partial [Pyrinomonadaceae bacterium]|nr:S1/P1 nuclease [Pyrinomonadaceae bacterium]